MSASPVGATPADHLAALAEVEGVIQQRLIAAEARLVEAERARLSSAVRLAETAARRRQLIALAVARTLLAERARAADRLAAHVEDGARR